MSMSRAVFLQTELLNKNLGIKKKCNNRKELYSLAIIMIEETDNSSHLQSKIKAFAGHIKTYLFPTKTNTANTQSKQRICVSYTIFFWPPMP